MHSSIRARTTAVFAVTIMALMALACGGLVIKARHAARQEARDHLVSAAAFVNYELLVERQTPVHAVQEGQRILSSEAISVSLVGGDGQVIVPAPNGPSPGELDNARPWMVRRVSVGKDWIVIAHDQRETEASLHSVTVTLSVLAVFAILITTAGAWILVGRTLSPIGKLSNQANSATPDGLRVRLEEPSQDAEIVDLVATLNGLLERLSEAAASKGRFYSAASHELRTPLQALSGHLELALGRNRTPDEYRAAIEEAYRQTRKLTKLTKSLLLLYQLDASAKPIGEPADLAAICHDTLKELEPLADERSIRVTADLPASMPFIAPPTHAEVLVRNLVENAVRYAKGEVRVWMEDSALHILNDADLPPDWSPEPLFEPFARGDYSRNALTGGTGLGLAISRAVADVNGWILTLARMPEGVLATLTIPSSTRDP